MKSKAAFLGKTKPELSHGSCPEFTTEEEFRPLAKFCPYCAQSLTPNQPIAPKAELSGGVGTITTVDGREVIVDIEVEWFLSMFGWWVRSHRRNEYATTNDLPSTMSMHSVIMGRTEPGDVIDHINGNGLDNRRENLRIITHRENLLNSRPQLGRKYKGVSETKSGSFAATICGTKHNPRWFATYSDEKSAALAYDRKVRELRGQCAYTNFSEEEFMAFDPDTNLISKAPHPSLGRGIRVRPRARFGDVVYDTKGSVDGKHQWLGTYPCPALALCSRKLNVKLRGAV